MRKIRTVSINKRGQLVVPEDMRKDMEIKGETTLVLIENSGEIVLKKETDVLRAMDKDTFWGTLSHEAMKRAWNKEDEIWDDIAKGE